LNEVDWRTDTTKFIHKTDDLNRLRSVLRKSPRDLLFLEMAIHSGLHAKDLLILKVADLRGVKPGEKLRLRRIVGASNQLVLSSVIYRIFLNYLREENLTDEDYLFRSQKGGMPLTLVSQSRLVSRWFEEAGLSISGGILALRRTWKYHSGGDNRKGAKGAKQQNSKTPIDQELEKSISRRDMVYRELQHEIVSGRHIPGQRIFIENISRGMGVSPIPVREAFAMLEAGGFINSDKKRGYLVNELSESNLREILKIRLLLECAAGEQAAQCPSEQAADRLEEIQSRYIAARTTNDFEALLKTNKEFHHAIYREADMPILKSQIDRLWDRVSPYYHIMFRQVEKPNPVIGIHYHQRMIDAIRNHKPREMRRWIKADLSDSTRFVIELFTLHLSGVIEMS
jgi:DNA-binding GntR family transcriptional regulator